MRASHSSRNAVVRWSRDSCKAFAIARPSSSRFSVREAATTARSSRRRYSLPAVCATEARSFHSARRTVGLSSSAMASNASPATGGFPAALAAVFCASMAWRTACRPPRKSCSAIGICSGRRVASMALRCTVDVGAAGRSPRAGRPSRSPGRRPPGRRGPLAARGRSPRSPPRSSLCGLRHRPRGRGGRAGLGGRRRHRRRAAAWRTRGQGSLKRRVHAWGCRGPRYGPRSSRASAAAWSPTATGPRSPRGSPRRRRAARNRPSRRKAPAPPRRRPWAGARPRRARSRTRPRFGWSTRCRSGVTCGGHATALGTGRRCRRPVGIP